MISEIQACFLLMLICNSLSQMTSPKITADRNVTEIEEGNSTMKIFTISASEENGGTVQIVAACQTNDIVNLNETMIGSNTSVDVYLKEPLDRETQSNYTLRFKAISNFTSLRSTDVEVSLMVLDINDTPPLFSQVTYLLELEEDTPLFSILNASIWADDPDSGLGGLVNYSLQDSRFYSNTFKIDQRNGSIQLLQYLDYEKQTFYQYRIIATDGGDPKLSSTADLLIIVKDVQDTPPIFQRLPFMTTMSENTPLGTSIYEIFATDGDTGIPDKITYSLTYQSKETACDDFLQINNITGVISINRKMDRDDGTIKRLNGICIVNVTASEITNATANNNSQTTKPFTIIVLDENDNPPKFTKKLYEGSVKEIMTDITISIPGNIHVSDIDQNGYNNIQLTILNRTDVVPSPDSVIHDGTVLLRLVSPLDYEKEKNITFMIKAEDINYPSFVDHCTVISSIYSDIEVEV